MIVLREAAYHAVPWKNGGGITREICRQPADSAMFDWRLSLATIDRPGPFSAFAGYSRILALVRGAGVELDFGAHGRATLSSAGQTVSFDGGWQTACTLIDGASTDLNLIVSKMRAESTSRCEQLSHAASISTAEWLETLVCCVSGAVRITNTAGASEELGTVDTARCCPSDGTVVCSPVGTAAAQIFIATVRGAARAP